MTKIDVAINSYKKPESLIYTLMTLKKVAADLIDTVYINDDCSDNGAYELYTHPAVADISSPGNWMFGLIRIMWELRKFMSGDIVRLICGH